MKANDYVNSDWMWLYKSIEREVTSWCNRWVSLGRRLTLIKTVLDANPVYWLSMAFIPKGIINKIRKKVF
jgi:hypothetical protein